MEVFIVAILLVTASSMALARGGGCRKSSPLGLCCHMEKATGIVHCH